MSRPARSLSPPTAGATRRIGLPAVLVLMAAFSSILATVWLANSRGSVFAGVVFGVAMACGLTIFKALPNLFGALVLILTSTFAYFFAYLACFFTQMALSGFGLLTQAEESNMGNPGSASPITLIVGGLVGGFLLGGAFLFFATPQNGSRRKLRRALVWSLGSAGLAFVGWALSPLLGPILSPLVHGVRPGEAWLTANFRIPGGTIGMISSVHFVWQTGMALAMALVAQRNVGPRRKELL